MISIDDVGRRFAATRLLLPFEHVRVGHLATWTERPALARDALVNALDFELTPNDWWRLAGQVVRSDIDVATNVRTDGYESWLQADFNRAAPLTHSLKLLHIDRHFDMNDMGYMERNSLQQAEWETFRRVAADSSTSRVSGETQRLQLQYRENLDGERLQSRVLVSRDVQYRSAWRAFEELRYIPSGVDDVLSRGQRTSPSGSAHRCLYRSDLAAIRRLGLHLRRLLFQQGVQDYSAWVFATAAWYPHEKLTLRLTLQPQWSDDWLLWENDNRFASYQARRLDFDFRLDWIPAPRHELRVKWQWIGIDAEAPRGLSHQQARRPRGRRRGSFRRSPPAVWGCRFAIASRWVRSRISSSSMAAAACNCGSTMSATSAELFTDMSDVRDADQFLIKIRHRL